MKLATLCAGLELMASPALALPSYDIAAFCKESATDGGVYDASVYMTCDSIEQLALKQLTPVWDKVPAPVQETCDKTATYLGAGSYSLLQTCVQMKNH